MAKKKSSNFDDLDSLILDMNRKAGKEVITLGLPEYEYVRIPFTSPVMNYCTYGGIPIGYLVELFGEEHSGKTTTALDIIANYQQMEDHKKIMYIDIDNTLDADWAVKLGVDMDDIYIYTPDGDSAEYILEFAINAIKTGSVGLLILDSIGAMVSEQELDKQMDEKTYAGISAPLSRFAKEAAQFSKANSCTVVGINQMREDLNSMWGGYKTPGGKAWKYMCQIRLQFSEGKFLDEDGQELNKSAGEPNGKLIMMSMKKNKSCPPKRRVGQYSIDFDYGVNYYKDLADACILSGIIEKRGAVYDVFDKDSGEIYRQGVKGMKQLIKYLVNNEDIAEALYDSLQAFNELQPIE